MHSTIVTAITSHVCDRCTKPHLGQEHRHTVVEVWVELMDHGLVLDDGE